MEKLESILKKINFVLLLFLCVNVFFQVILRYIFGYSFRWTIEISRYVMIYVVFICLGPAYKKGLLIGMVITEKKLTCNQKKIMNVFKFIAMILFALVIIVMSINIISLQLEMMQLSPAMQIPIGLVYLAIPLGFAVFIIYMVLLLLKELGVIR